MYEEALPLHDRAVAITITDRVFGADHPNPSPLGEKREEKNETSSVKNAVTSTKSETSSPKSPVTSTKNETSSPKNALTSTKHEASSPKSALSSTQSRISTVATQANKSLHRNAASWSVEYLKPSASGELSRYAARSGLDP